MLNLAGLLNRSAITAGDPRDNFWFTNLSNARQTNSGETVTPQRSLTLAAYYACIRVVSEDVAKLPVHVCRSLEPRGKVTLYDHPVYKLLHDAPNPEMTAFTFRETMTQWALGWGAGYAEIVRDGLGNLIELWPIHPSRCRLKRINGRLTLLVSSDPEFSTAAKQTQKITQLDMRDVLHIRGMGTEVNGYSVAAYAAESIGSALAAESYGARFFANGASANGILTHPGKLSDTARANLRESWKKVYGGPKGERLVIAEEGLKYEQISIPPNESQFLETMQFKVEEVCRWFRVSPHKVQHLLRSTFSNIEQQSIEHVTDTLMPWLVRWESETKRSLIGDDPRVYLAHNVNGLLRGDVNSRVNYYRTMTNIGAMSPNDVREYEDENPIPGEAGDEYYMQSNMTTLERIAAGQVATAAPVAKTDPSSAGYNDATERREQFAAHIDTMRPALLAAADRVLRKEALAVGRQAGRVGVAAWAETFFREQANYLTEATGPLIIALCRVGSDVLGENLAVVDLGGFAAAYCEEARKRVAAGMPLDASRTPNGLTDALVGLVLDGYPGGADETAKPTGYTVIRDTLGRALNLVEITS